MSARGVRTRAALLDAARSSFAERGPGAVSIRDLAAEAGCTHPLIGRYFGGKGGLEQAVSVDLGHRLDAVSFPSDAAPDELLACVLAHLRADPTDTRLLVRSALGDLDPAPLLDTASAFGIGLARALERDRTGRARRPGLRARVGAYCGLGLVLGWITLDRFLVAGTGLGRISMAKLDRAIVRSASTAARRWHDPGVPLRIGRREVREPETDAQLTDVRERLVEAAADLFAELGPVATSTRQVAADAALDQRVIYRHFASKDALLDAALDASWTPAYLAAAAPSGLDVDLVVELVRARPRAARTMARVLLDGMDVRRARTRYPIIQAALGRFDPMPRRAPLRPDDPRLAVGASVALGLGSAVWDGVLRTVTGVGRTDLDRSVADASRLLLERAGPRRPLAPPRP